MDSDQIAAVKELENRFLQCDTRDVVDALAMAHWNMEEAARALERLTVQIETGNVPPSPSITGMITTGGVTDEDMVHTSTADESATADPSSEEEEVAVDMFSTSVGVKRVVKTQGVTFVVDERYFVSDEVPLQLGRLGIIAAGYDTERQMQVQIVKVDGIVRDGSVSDATGGAYRMILRELRILSHLRGVPNIHPLLDVMMIPPEESRTFSDIYLVFPWAETSLQHLIDQGLMTVNNEETEWRRRHLLYFLLCGLRAVHSAGLVLRDIAAPSVYITDGGTFQPQLSSFGFARSVAGVAITPMDHYLSETIRLRAPDIIFHADQPTPAIDVWALGALHLEMLVGHDVLPYESKPYECLDNTFRLLGVPSEQVIAKISRGSARALVQSVVDSIKQDTPTEASDANMVMGSVASDLASNGVNEDEIDLLFGMLMWDQEERPTADQLLDHPFFAPDFHDGVDSIGQVVHKVTSNVEVDPFAIQDQAGAPLDLATTRRLLFHEMTRYHPEIQSVASVQDLKTAYPGLVDN